MSCVAMRCVALQLVAVRCGALRCDSRDYGYPAAPVKMCFVFAFVFVFLFRVLALSVCYIHSFDKNISSSALFCDGTHRRSMEVAFATCSSTVYKTKISLQHTKIYLKISGSKWAMSCSGMYGGLLMTASNVLEPSNGSTDPKVQKKNNNKWVTRKKTWCTWSI